MGWCIRPRTRRQGSSWPSRRSGWICECWGGAETPRPEVTPGPQLPVPLSSQGFTLLFRVLPSYTEVVTKVQPSRVLTPTRLPQASW